jgi:hypothetical protein
VAGIKLKIDRVQRIFYRERYFPMGDNTYVCGGGYDRPHEKILDILIYMGEFGLSTRAAARQAGLTIQSIEDWQREDPVLAEAVAECREIADDRVLYGVYRAATIAGKDGRISIPAAKMWLMHRQPNIWRGIDDGTNSASVDIDDARLLVELVRVSVHLGAGGPNGSAFAGREAAALGGGNGLGEVEAAASTRTDRGLEDLVATVGTGRRKDANGGGNGSEEN